jgi:hypothetical protein
MKNKIIKNSLYGTEPVLYVNSEVDKLFQKFDASVYRKKLGDNHKVHGIKKNGK